MANTDIVFSGLYHLAGKTVSACVAGLDCGDYVVSAAGQITVPLQSDKDKKFAAAWIAQVSASGVDFGAAAATVQIGDTVYTVPVVIGLSYSTQGQLLRAVDQAEVKAQLGPSLGRTRRTQHAAVLFNNTTNSDLSLGTDFNKMTPVALADKSGTKLADTTPFSGVHSTVLTDDYSFDSMVAWQVTRPTPCTVCSIAGFLHTNER